jgi:RimJ/RimL family protein N-acetyltransferase
MTLQVKKFREKDVRSVCSWIKSETVMVQWAGLIFSWPFTQKQFREHLRAARTGTPTLYPFGLYLGSILIGYCELSAYNRKSNSAQLSRVIVSPKYRNRGFAQIMIENVFAFGFQELELNRISLGVFDFNKPAIKCYKKLGFVLEGTLRESAKVGDSFWDCLIMSILRKEWCRQNHSQMRR